jgi:7-carboxy-7-deazaguanine synthase
METNSQMKYPVMEHFYTLQGEGQWTGSAAYFVRLGGCDVGCSWCDVKESWEASDHQKFTTDEIIKWIIPSKTPIAVITGGEPTLYDLSELTSTIHDQNIRTHIETSGTNPLTGNWDWITFSPKRFKKPLEEFFEKSHEIKIIIAHRNDLRWALELGAKMHSSALLYIQPEWDMRSEMESACIEFIKENPRWKLSLQTHKYLGID